MKRDRYLGLVGFYAPKAFAKGRELLRGEIKVGTELGGDDPVDFVLLGGIEPHAFPIALVERRLQNSETDVVRIGFDATAVSLGNPSTIGLQAGDDVARVVSNAMNRLGKSAELR